MLDEYKHIIYHFFDIWRCRGVSRQNFKISIKQTNGEWLNFSRGGIAMSRQNKKMSYSIQYKEAFKKWKKETGKKITSNGVLVMKILIEYVNNETGLAFPSVEKIMEESELSKSAVFKKLNLLKDVGLIKRNKREGKSGYKRNEYQILLNNHFTDESPENVQVIDSPNDDDIPF
jgi:predicted transcriptional regulator